MYRIGIDVGGTFTDFTLLHTGTGEVNYFKLSSTPKDPSEAIRLGISHLLAEYSIRSDEVSFVGHGTTVATNMIIERQGVKTGLLTTKGFRDVLDIGRQTRPNLYDYNDRKPDPLVPRERRLEVNERIDFDGEVVQDLDQPSLLQSLERLKSANIEAVAICFIHSYRNPGHENLARQQVEKMMPGVYVSVSSEVLPEFREYERLSTTVLNAYCGPKMQTYLDRLDASVRQMGVKQSPYTIHSNGGLMSISTVRKFPVRTCLSGPAAGVVGSAVVGSSAGFPNLITFDVGGTSTDVSIVKGGKPVYASNRLVADYPIKMPMVDIHVIGAGGGSIAWIDDAGGLKVGPRSAGALPGPVAYGKGGEQPTATDANVCLQRLNPVALLNGRLPIDASNARDVLVKKIATPLNLDMEKTAHGVLRILTANMGRAIRSVSTERGYDLSDFALFAYGGAGPLHAAEVAEECGIPVVIIPQEPGTMCARGILLTDVTLNFVRTEISTVGPAVWQKIVSYFREMEMEGNSWLGHEKVASEHRAFRRYIEARYEGQNYEIVVELEDVSESGLEGFTDSFRQGHIKEYGYEIPGRPIQIVNCRVEAIGRVPKARLKEISTEQIAGIDRARVGERPVYFGDRWGWVETSVYQRDRLPVGEIVKGPAIIEEMSSTTVVLPTNRFVLDRLGNIVIHVRPKDSK